MPLDSDENLYWLANSIFEKIAWGKNAITIGTDDTEWTELIGFALYTWQMYHSELAKQIEFSPIKPSFLPEGKKVDLKKVFSRICATETTTLSFSDFLKEIDLVVFCSNRPFGIRQRLMALQFCVKILPIIRSRVESKARSIKKLFSL